MSLKTEAQSSSGLFCWQPGTAWAQLPAGRMLGGSGPVGQSQGSPAQHLCPPHNHPYQFLPLRWLTGSMSA